MLSIVSPKQGGLVKAGDETLVSASIKLSAATKEVFVAEESTLPGREHAIDSFLLPRLFAF